MERVVFVYTAYPSLVEAETAGRALVEQRPGARSAKVDTGFASERAPLLNKKASSSREPVSTSLENALACFDILPGMVSHYWWDGKLERGQEAVNPRRASGPIPKFAHACGSL